MKKKIIFYIAWDAVLYVFMNAICNIEVKIFDAYFRMENPYLIFFVPVILRIAAGALICWLIIVTMKQEVTVKSAVAEFVLIGGFGLYLAAGLIIYFLIPIHVTGTYPLHIWPRWLPLDEHMITITIGGILFGYELVMFIYRIIICKRLSQKQKPGSHEAL